jgi:hypothetical protein
VGTYSVPESVTKVIVAFGAVGGTVAGALMGIEYASGDPDHVFFTSIVVALIAGIFGTSLAACVVGLISLLDYLWPLSEQFPDGEEADYQEVPWSGAVGQDPSRIDRRY